MLPDHQTSNFIGMKADQFTRDERAAAVKAYDDACEYLRHHARVAANMVALVAPEFIDVKDRRTPNFPLQVDEAIEGKVEIISTDFAELFDNDKIERARNIAERGRE